MNEQQHLLAITQSTILGPSRLKHLRGFFNSWQAIWQADEQELQAAGLSETTIKKLLLHRQSFNFEYAQQLLEQYHIEYITFEDSLYPPLLHSLPDPPPLLYYQGSLSSLQSPTVTIVGSRHPQAKNLKLLEEIIPKLVTAGYSIVSGLAIGTDTLVHRLTLENNGITIGVLPSPLDTIYPASNKSLAQEIIKTGCLLSEYTPGTILTKGNFLRRNRLLASLSNTIIVVDRRTQSGTEYTAQYAKKLQRQVIHLSSLIDIQSLTERRETVD